MQVPAMMAVRLVRRGGSTMPGPLPPPRAGDPCGLMTTRGPCAALYHVSSAGSDGCSWVSHGGRGGREGFQPLMFSKCPFTAKLTPLRIPGQVPIMGHDQHARVVSDQTVIAALRPILFRLTPTSRRGGCAAGAARRRVGRASG